MREEQSRTAGLREHHLVVPASAGGSSRSSISWRSNQNRSQRPRTRRSRIDFTVRVVEFADMAPTPIRGLPPVEMAGGSGEVPPEHGWVRDNYGWTGRIGSAVTTSQGARKDIVGSWKGRHR
jgi:hypothetical protein